MSKNKNTGFFRGLGIGAFGAVLGCMVVGSALDGGVFDRTSGGLRTRDIRLKIDSLQGIIDDYYLFDEDIVQVEDSIYKGMMSGLGDPYSVYYTPDEFAKMMEQTEGRFYGIGAEVNMSEPGQILVVNVYENSPAEKGGMQKGDLIMEVDGVRVSDIDPELFVEQYIRGEEGSYVDIVVLREGKIENLHIQRGQVEVVTVHSRMMEQQIGYIQVIKFDNVTTEQFIKAVSGLEMQGMKALVIDLRNNPGGVLETAVEMAAYILPENLMGGVIVSTADKNGVGKRYYCKDGQILEGPNGKSGGDDIFINTDDHQLDIPIVVLQNGYSASASEVFAGALKDYGSARLVGTTSFGKGIVQSLLQLGDGSAVKLTVAHYYTPSGFDLHGKGLKPDVEVELSEELRNEPEVSAKQDNQLHKAVELLMDEIE